MPYGFTDFEYSLVFRHLKDLRHLDTIPHPSRKQRWRKRRAHIKFLLRQNLVTARSISPPPEELLTSTRVHESLRRRNRYPHTHNPFN
jgi:hypothetical protein